MFARIAKFVFPFILVCFVTAGCSHGVSEGGQPMPALSYEGINQIYIDVSDMKVANHFQKFGRNVDVYDELPNMPDDAILRYLQNRFKPAGSFGVLEVSLQDAKVTKEYVESESGFMRTLGMGDNFVYRASVILDMFHHSNLSQQNVQSRITANKEIVIPDSYSLSQRDEALFTFVEELILELDREILRSFSQTFRIRMKPVDGGSTLPEMRGQQYQNGK